MGFRIVTIDKHCKLEFRMNYVVVRSQEEIKKVLLDEISILIIENTAVSVTAVLLQELINKNIDVIFCDNQRNPNSVLLPLYGRHNSSSMIRKQVNWPSEIKQQVWTAIVKEKVKKQGEMIKLQGIDDDNYFSDKYNLISLNDESNIEAQTAKKYFHLMFGKDFVRAADTPLNSALNYGYGILLSAFNREVVKNGYITQIGIGHSNVNNQFNFGCDLMEPFRPLVDKIVKEIEIKDSFGTEEKHKILSIVYDQLKIDNKSYYLFDVIEKYSVAVFNAIENEDVSLLKFYAYGEN